MGSKKQGIGPSRNRHIKSHSYNTCDPVYNVLDRMLESWGVIDNLANTRKLDDTKRVSSMVRSLMEDRKTIIEIIDSIDSKPLDFLERRFIDSCVLKTQQILEIIASSA